MARLRVGCPGAAVRVWAAWHSWRGTTRRGRQGGAESDMATPGSSRRAACGITWQGDSWRVLVRLVEAGMARNRDSWKGLKRAVLAGEDLAWMVRQGPSRIGGAGKSRPCMGGLGMDRPARLGRSVLGSEVRGLDGQGSSGKARTGLARHGVDRQSTLGCESSGPGRRRNGEAVQAWRCL